MIFLSCYLALFYISLLAVLQFPHLQHNFQNFRCTVALWLNGLAVPPNLIISTLIVKMVQVYRIFRRTTINSKCLSNMALFIQILVLMIPNLVILMLWSVTDTYSIKIMYYSNSGDTFSVKECHSEHLTV